MKLEIEIKSPDAKNDIYELRNFLQENVDDVHLKIKEEAPQAGQMSLAVIGSFVLESMLHVATNMSIEEMYNRTLKPKIVQWLQSRKKTAEGDLEVLSTVKDDTAKIHFVEDSTGKSQVFNNVYYAIDTDRTMAVLIGTGEFDSDFPPIPPVKGNIEDFYNLLTDKTRIGLPQQNVSIAYNKTNTEIEELLLQTSRIPNIETLIIYFAGHGHRTDIKKLYLIARNTRKIDDYILGGIDFDFISNAVLKSSTARQKIMILDACHSGIATQGDDNLLVQTDVKGTYILASSPGDDVSYFTKNGRNTYFTGSIIDVLKNGIDNTKEMLTLDDLYDYSKEHLSKKNFPHPIFKSELNIPPSNFSIARNPAFSLDKVKLRIAQLLRTGKAEDALYEYHLLLNQYPGDMQLRKDAAACETQVMFSRLVQEGDELFFHHRDYYGASEKYKKAVQVKDDMLVSGKINKCEEYIRLQQRQGIKDDKTIKQNIPTPVQQKEENELPVIQEKRNNDNKIPYRKKAGNENNGAWITAAAAWLIGGIIFHYVRIPYTNNAADFFKTATLPFSIPGIALVLIRLKKITNYEILLYANGALPAAIILSAAIQFTNFTFYSAIAIMVLSGIAYLFILSRIIRSLNIVQFALAGIALIYFPVCFFLLIFDIAERHWSFSTSTTERLGAGIVCGLISVFIFYKRWKKRNR